MEGMKRTIAALGAVLALTGLHGVASAMNGMAGMSGMAAQAMPRQKVVYHINGDDARLQSLALGNMQNHINAIGKDNIDLKVVLHGDGVALLLYPDALAKTKMKAANATEETQSKIAGLKQLGVQFQVCATTLKSRNVDAKDLYDFDQKDLVPSGVAQLGILQSQGFAYVKP
jgi:hypothetical protein